MPFTRRRSESAAEMLDGTEGVLVDKGPSFVIERFDHMDALRGQMYKFVAACADEWYDFAEVDPRMLERFLEHRTDTLHTLAHREHWLGTASTGVDMSSTSDDTILHGYSIIRVSLDDHRDDTVPVGVVRVGHRQVLVQLAMA